MKIAAWLALIALVLMAGIVSAAPTTGAAAMIGTNNVTLSATGASGTVAWFQYGTAHNAAWAHLPNQSVSGGSLNYTWKGSPLWSGTPWYVRACDVTGCGNEVMFNITAATPLPDINLGGPMQNITENRFDVQNLIWNSAQPYILVTGATIFYGAIFAMPILGLFLKTRGTGMGTMLTMILAGLFCSSVVGLSLGFPPEFTAILQAVMYVSLAGTILGWLFK
jgi:hypothetical protein